MPTEHRSAPPVARTAELFAPIRPGVELCYQAFGSPDDDPLLLVMGLGAPMTWWDDVLCERLAGRGFYVVRFDNRDAGRSSRMPGRVGRAAMLRAAAGLPVRAPYALTDMAQDAVGLLDHLGLASAHVVGASMGGMIGQTLALEHPDRVRSLTSIMSSTGRRTVGWQHPRLATTFLLGRSGRDGYVRGSLATWRIIGSPGYPTDDATWRRRAEDTWDRGVSQAGTLRQILAILTQPDRTARLRELSIPAVVVHGRQDRMVHVSGGRATAAAIPGAELLLIDGMGHDLPPALFETFTRAVRRTADRATPV